MLSTLESKLTFKRGSPSFSSSSSSSSELCSSILERQHFNYDFVTREKVTLALSGDKDLSTERVSRRDTGSSGSKLGRRKSAMKKEVERAQSFLLKGSSKCLPFKVSWSSSQASRSTFIVCRLLSPCKSFCGSKFEF